MTEILTLEEIEALEALMVAAPIAHCRANGMHMAQADWNYLEELVRSAPALIAMACKLHDVVGEIKPEADRVVAGYDKLSGIIGELRGLSKTALAFQQSRAEKAEAEAARYRDMAVRLGQSILKHAETHLGACCNDANEELWATLNASDIDDLMSEVRDHRGT